MAVTNGIFLVPASPVYEVTGLAPGSYFATTDASLFLVELYDDLPCPGGPPGGCDPTTGTPIVVTGGATTAGVDFALAINGAISGTVTDAASGDPISSVEVWIWDVSGDYGGYGYTDSSGYYRVAGLAPGTYFATAWAYAFIDELYDDLPCPGSCDPTTGTPIAVTSGVETTGIDFALGRPGAISGIVSDAETGQPLADVGVNLWSASGSHMDWTYTDSAGIFTFGWLGPGTYFLTTNNYDGYLDELYDDVPCPGGSGCTVTKGTSVQVLANTTTRHVHFALEYFGSGIAGTVTDGGTGLPLANVFVDAWDDTGQLEETAVTNADGSYLLKLNPGTYFVSTDNGQGLADEVYDDLLCPAGPASAGLCDPTAGTPVVVEGLAGQVVGGIDFALGSTEIFSDGFESGDLSAWSSVAGEVDL